MLQHTALYSQFQLVISSNFQNATKNYKTAKCISFVVEQFQITFI